MSKVRQYIGVCGEARRLVEAASNISEARRASDGEPIGQDPTADMLILHGFGEWYPAVQAESWAAICDEPKAGDEMLSDITPVLGMLLVASVMPVSDASPAEVASWLKGNH
jgi:hypothetical protein